MVEHKLAVLAANVTVFKLLLDNSDKVRSSRWDMVVFNSLLGKYEV